MYRAEYIDFAYLNGDAAIDGLRKALAIVREHSPRGFCVNPSVLDLLYRFEDLQDVFFFELKNLGILRQFTIDFPLGQGGLAAKRDVAERLLKPVELADEFDVVANIGAILADDFLGFKKELRPLIALGKPVKIIVETGYYPDDNAALERALDWCVRLGAFAIKTSTGFLQNIDNTAKCRHVAFWRRLITERGYTIKIKDAGGKRTREDIDASLEAGADIIGISALIE